MTDEARERRWAAVYAERERLLRVARRRTVDAAEAEDCVSEAMLRCFEFPDLDEDRIPAFLTTVTIRLCADQHRARARLARAGGRLAGPEIEPSAEESVCDRAEAAWLAAEVGRLPARQRRVVEARAAGLSCADVASRFDVSVDAVKSAVARARTTVRSALASTLGLVPAVAARYRFAAGAAAGGAAAGIAVGGLLVVLPAPPRFAAPVPSRPPVLAPAPGAPAARIAVERQAEPVVPAAPGIPRRPAAAVRVPPPAAAPVERPAPASARRVGPAAVEDDGNNDRYSLTQRVEHCLSEGVELGPPIRCRTPEGEAE